MSVLKREIAQQRPFSSPAEEALLNLMRTADCVQRAVQRKTRAFGITSTQYNVLRILRGSQPQGVTCSAIGDRMITAEPDITRLLARMKALKLVRQQRDKRDRRVVWTHITATGLALLSDMDPMVQQYPLELFAHLDQQQLNDMIHLLELARKNCGDTPAPVSCDGKDSSPGEPCPSS